MRSPRRGAVHRHHHHGGVVEVGIVALSYWKAQPPGRTSGRSSAQSPLTSSTCSGFSHSARAAAPLRPRAPASSSAWADQRGVPHRREAGLAVGLVLVDHQQLLHRLRGDGARSDGPRGQPSTSYIITLLAMAG